jgi:hypothetical protein
MSEQDERPADAAEPAGERTEAADAPGPAAPQATPAQAENTAPAVPAADSTGDDRVDQALSRLAELDAEPVHEHAAVVEAIHRSLQDTLAEDEG